MAEKLLFDQNTSISVSDIRCNCILSLCDQIAIKNGVKGTGSR